VTLEALLARLNACLQAPASALTDGVAGIAALSEDRVMAVNGAHARPVAQYGELPAWDLVDIERYRRTWLEAHGYFSLNMAASAGSQAAVS
jgi:anaerobic magnesium-protoporphyrin IX monomethyl ester cyclase